MKKLIILFLCVCIALCFAGCADDYPTVSINPKPFDNIIEIDLGNKQLKFNTFERIDDEEGTKLILYFDKASEKEK